MSGHAPVRRIVTGHDVDGEPVIVADTVVEPVTVALAPGFESFELWSTAGTSTLPDDVGGPEVPTYFPGPGGSVLRIVTIPPDTTANADDLDRDAALGEFRVKLPGALEHFDPQRPGMHTSDTVDYDIVLTGQLVLVLGSGEETTVDTGAVVVQRGTTHAWRNRTEQPARLASVLLGAPRR